MENLLTKGITVRISIKYCFVRLVRAETQSGYLYRMFQQLARRQIYAVLNFMVTPCINNTEPFLLPTDAHNVKKRRVIKTF